MNEENKLKIFNHAVNYLWGGLWWCREQLVRQKFSSWLVNDRIGHPVLSLRRQPLQSVCDIVPMLVGTSGGQGPVIVRELTAEEDKERQTSFGMIIEPGWFSMDEFLHYEKTPEPVLTGQWFEVKKMWPNFHKPQLTKDEDIQARAFAIHYKNLIRYPNGESL